MNGSSRVDDSMWLSLHPRLVMLFFGGSPTWSMMLCASFSMASRTFGSWSMSM